MGWKGYESHIELGMIFRKMYCSNCGEKLKKKKITNTYNKGDAKYQSHILGHATIGMDRIQKSEFVYQCPKCFKITTYAEQVLINKTQKMLNKKVLVIDEILKK